MKVGRKKDDFSSQGIAGLLGTPSPENPLVISSQGSLESAPNPPGCVMRVMFHPGVLGNRTDVKSARSGIT